MTMELQNVIVNLAGKVREAVMNGRKYLVAPLTTIVPGVLNGSKGALYYPPEEISRNHQQWNGIPIVVNHPVDPITNQHLSARDPDVIDRQGIGVVLRSTFNGKLTHEGWFDVDATRNYDAKHGTSILEAVQNGHAVELSTGLYTDNEPQSGTFNGVAYTHIARNYRADHLAILPHQKGACSVNDGCGVNVNEANTADAKQSLWQKLGGLLGITANTPKHPRTGKFHPEGLMPHAHAEKGYDTHADNDDEEVSTLEDDLDPQTVTKNSQESRCDDECEDDDECFDDCMTGNTMKRSEIITELTTNCDCWKGDAKAKTLNAMTDEKLRKLYGVHLTINAAEMDRDEKGHGCDGEADDAECKAMFARMSNNARRNLAKLLGNAIPPQFMKKKEDEEEEEETTEEPVEEEETMNTRQPITNRLTSDELEVWNTAVEINATAKQQLVKKLTANVSDADKKKRLTANLSKKSVQELRDLVELLPKPVQRRYEPSYVGNSGGPDDGDTTTNDASEDDQLEIATLNYTELAKEANAQRTA